MIAVDPQIIRDIHIVVNVGVNAIKRLKPIGINSEQSSLLLTEARSVSVVGKSDKNFSV